MGCLKLTYHQAFETPLKVVYRTKEAEQKSVQRFLSVDPLSEMTISETPYHYVSNNPLRFTDPTGMFKIEFGDGFSREEKRAWRKSIRNSVGTSESDDSGNENSENEQQSKKEIGFTIKTSEK